MHVLHHLLLIGALLQAPTNGDTTRTLGPVRTALGSKPAQPRQPQQKTQLVEYSDIMLPIFREE